MGGDLNIQTVQHHKMANGFIDLVQWKKESDKLKNDYLNGLFPIIFGDLTSNPKNTHPRNLTIYA